MPQCECKEAVRGFRTSCGPGDHGLHTAALNLLQASSFAALRRLRCEVAEGVVIVHGVVPSY
jgi:hypothetical protein